MRADAGRTRPGDAPSVAAPIDAGAEARRAEDLGLPEGPQVRKEVSPVGLEPTRFGLKVRCSAH